MMSRYKNMMAGSFAPSAGVRKAYLIIARARAILDTLPIVLLPIALVVTLFLDLSFEYLEIAIESLVKLIIALLGIVHLIHWNYEKKMQKRRDLQAMRYLFVPEKPHTLEPHSLFLRAFYTSNFFHRLQVRNSRYVGWPWPPIENIIGKNIDLETLLACILESHSHLIGIGRSAGSAVSGKVITSDSEWKRVFCTLAQSAEFIVHVVANRPGTKWEFKQIIDNSHLSSKTLFIVPGSGTGFRSIGLSRRVRKDYSGLRSELQADGYSLPRYQKQGHILSYSHELSEFIHYPSGNFEFRYLNDLIDSTHDLVVADKCFENREFVRLLSPIRWNNSYYVARIVEWKKEDLNQLPFLEQSIEDGSCLVTMIEHGLDFPCKPKSFRYHHKLVIANPRLFTSPKIASMMRRDANFFSMRDTIIRKSKIYQAAHRQQLANIDLRGLRNAGQLQAKVFGTDERELENIGKFIGKHRKFFNHEECYLWESYIRDRKRSE